MTDCLAGFKRLCLAYLFFLVLMSIFRAVFYYSFLEPSSLTFSGGGEALLRMYFLGFRLDLTVIGYMQIIPSFCLIGLYYFRSNSFNVLNKFFLFYLFILFSFASLLYAGDYVFYSYFREHYNALFWGILDDDQIALLQIFWKNYPVVIIVISFFIYFFVLWKILKYIFLKKMSFRCHLVVLFSRFSPLFFLLLLGINFMCIRGTFGLYPLGTNLQDVCDNVYVNKMVQNGVRTFFDVCDLRLRQTTQDPDLIKECGFQNAEEAFYLYAKIHGKPFDSNNLLATLTDTTDLGIKPYNIVVLQVEGFGLPIVQYQSEDFDILGRLQKHFAEDIVFRRIISDGNGTIQALEALLLNIPYCPGYYVRALSHQAGTSFTHSPAFLYAQNGYETTFFYGGDLSWYRLGSFVPKQGYKNVFGKMNIYNAISKEYEKEYYFHPYGIYDEYLFDCIFDILIKSNKKEFIYALTTNNHPPFDIPKHFENKKLVCSEKLRSQVTGNMDRMYKRLISYAYVLDAIGGFLDKIKSSHLKDTTIVVVTADNNTISSTMTWEKEPLFESVNVPIYFYLPPNLKKTLYIDTTVGGSEKDIFPTLYNLTLNGQKYISVGVNLFDKNSVHYGLNGMKIVTDGKRTIKLKSLKDNQDELSLYYRVCIAVSDYLLKSYLK